MFDQDWFYQLCKVSKQVTQQWLDTFIPTGAWTVYGTPHDEMQKAKQMAGRMFVFKKSVRVRPEGGKYVLYTRG